MPIDFRAYDACAKPHNDWADSQFRAIAVADLHPSTRKNREMAVNRTADDRIRAACGKHVDAARAALTAAIEERNEHRGALYAAVGSAGT